jgi:PTS system mannose-specific IID component
MDLNHLRFGDKLRLLWRSLFVQVFWNYRTLQGEGFLFALLPFLRRYEPDSEKRRHLMKLSSGFMNTHPCLAPMAMGAILRRMADGGKFDEQQWHGWREGLCGPLGTLGDRLIWDGWKPFVFIVAANSLLLFGSSRAILPISLAILLVYNGPLWGFRLWGFDEGWRLGPDVLRSIERPLFDRAQVWIERIGALLLGVLFVIGLAKSSLFQPLAMVQFVVAFGFLWISCAANWPLISSLVVALGFVSLSAWLVQLIF